MLEGDANAVLSNTTVFRIIQSPDPTAASPVAGVLGVDNITAVGEPNNPVPEPATVLLVGSALVAIGARQLRRTRQL